MMRGFGEDTLNDTFGELAGALILFLDNTHFHSRPDIGSVLPVHFDI